MPTADVLSGLIDTAILTKTRNHSQGAATGFDTDIREIAPKKGMLRLMPASSVAETACAAYHHPKRLHWYVPKSIRWIDRLKGLGHELCVAGCSRLFRRLRSGNADWRAKAFRDHKEHNSIYVRKSDCEWRHGRHYSVIATTTGHADEE